MSITITRPASGRGHFDLRELNGAPPERSIAQRMDALARANDVRFRRAELKRDLKAGRSDVRALLMNPPDYIATMKLVDLLLATPKWGRVRVSRALARADSSGRPISASKTVGGLSDRVRRELVVWMGRR